MIYDRAFLEQTVPISARLDDGPGGVFRGLSHVFSFPSTFLYPPPKRRDPQPPQGASTAAATSRGPATSTSLGPEYSSGKNTSAAIAHSRNIPPQTACAVRRTATGGLDHQTYKIFQEGQVIIHSNDPSPRPLHFCFPAISSQTPSSPPPIPFRTSPCQ